MSDREILCGMTCTYLPTTLTRAKLRALLELHNTDVEDFDAEHPIREDGYRTIEVMGWIGY